MTHHREAFVAFDTAKLCNAVAVADAGRNGEIRYLGEIGNTETATRKLVAQRRWPFGLLHSASRRRRPKRREPKRGRLQRRKVMPSPAARWPPPRGSFLLPPLTQ